MDDGLLPKIDDYLLKIEDLWNRFALLIYIMEEFLVSLCTNHQSQIFNHCQVSRLCHQMTLRKTNEMLKFMTLRLELLIETLAAVCLPEGSVE